MLGTPVDEMVGTCILGDGRVRDGDYLMGRPDAGCIDYGPY